MKKIAIFVEGQTEQIFVTSLVEEALGRDNVSIILKRSRGGSSVPRYEIAKKKNIPLNPKYTALIYDCGADNRVKSEVMENVGSLANSGYSYIIGMRDLYPLPTEDLQRLEHGLKFIPKKFHKYHEEIDFIVVVQEIETWFLAESNHLQKVDKRLTSHFIKRHLGFDPYHENAMKRKHPSQDLDRIYRLVGRNYSKKYWQVQKLVHKLDFNNLENNVRYDIPALNHLLSILDKMRMSK
ncbi:DUF4276 family protein [Dysgonomonas sp. 520]|uniref:DUF4276 family protein n=1 Tax=Dysgonomonas sp. 520 TaxID=2302931 RepID=UPI0013D43EF7|nr:DUF4276 family protein [Dysgonomonas sp. 520]NDW09860.1 DUF4276 family protein [Dysgonomonas sp. 520]